MSASPADDVSSPDSDPGKYALLDQLAAEYAERFRNGERPDLREYIDRHPELAEMIRELFPAMVEIERADDGSDPGRRAVAAGAAPIAGQVGDYRILREVGRGGMGIVYEAEQLSLGRHVALKIMLGAWARDGRSLERFRREARAAARLHHTNIVPVFEVGQEGDVAYYAMQFIQGQGLDLVVRELRRLRDRSRGAGAATPAVSGGDPDPPAVSLRGPGLILNDLTIAESGAHSDGRISRITHAILTGRIDQVSPGSPADTDGRAEAPPSPEAEAPRVAAGSFPGPMDAPLSGSAVLPGGGSISGSEVPGRRTAFYRSVAQIGRQAAEALAYAHARGIIHRDIKPSNLLLDTAGVVWITDFGLAKGDDEGLTHTGDVIGTIRYMAPERFRGEGDARADVYALGLTLYELLVLQPAFHSSDRLRLMEKIRSQEPGRPRAIDPRIPRDLETIVLKAIEKEPRRRYADAASLADDLRRFHEGEPIRARPVTSLERAVKWVRRRPFIASSLSLIGVLASFLLLVQIRSKIAVEHALAEARLQQRRAEASERTALAAGATAEKERARAAAAALEARRQAARSTAREAQAAAESGAIEQGLFKLVDALELAPDETPGDRATRLAMRRSLAAWRAAHPVLRHLFEGVHRSEFIGEDGTTLALFSGRRLRLLDLVSGRELDGPGGREFPGLIEAVSPDGSLVIAGDAERALPFFDRDTGRPRALLPASPMWVAHIRGRQFGPGNRFFIHPVQEPNQAIIRCFRLDGQAGPVGPVRVLSFVGDVLDLRCYLMAARGGHTVLVEVPATSSAESGGISGRLRFWDLDADSEADGIRLEPGAHGRGWAFDGSALVTASPEGMVCWWDPATGRPIRPAWWPQRAAFAATLIDGGRVLVVGCDDRRIRWFDLARREECAPAVWMPMGSIHQVAISPGGMFFVAQGKNRLGVWQFAGPLRPSPSEEVATARVFYGDIAFHPDRSAYLLGQPPPDGLQINWPNLTSSRPALRRREAFSGGQYDVATERPIGPPLYPWMRYPTYSPDGRLIAAARAEWSRQGVPQSTVVGVWEARSGRPVMPLRPLMDWVHSMAFSPDGRMLAVGIVPGIELFEVPSGRHLGYLEQPGPISRLAFRPDGRILAAGTRTGWGNAVGVRLWDMATTRPAGPLFACAALPFFRFEPDGQALLVLDTEGRHLTRLDGATGIPRAPSHDLVELTASGTPARDEAGEGPTPRDLAYRSPAADLRPDGRVVAEASRGAVVRQWDVESGRPIGPPLVHQAPIMALAYSPDGATLACGGVDGAVRFWDASTGVVLGPSLPHGGMLLSLTFTPDGRRLVVVTRDGRPFTWEVPRAPSIDRPDRLREWVEASVGVLCREDETMVGFSADAWRDRLKRLGIEDPASAEITSPRGSLIAWHRDRARELERLGLHTPGLGHLDALERLCPDDWTLAARRGDMLIDHGHLGAAAREYARVERIARPDALTDWYWQVAFSLLNADSSSPRLDSARLATALSYLDRVIADRPDDWQPAFHRSLLLDRSDRHDEREAEEDRALARGAGPFIALDCAANAVALGRRERAGRLLGAVLDSIERPGEVMPGDAASWLATMLVYLRDTVRHHRLCRRLLEVRRESDFVSVIGDSDACLAGSVPLDVAERAVGRLEDLLPRTPDWRKPSVFSRLGAVFYRAGRPADAIRTLKEAKRRRGGESLEDLLYLAMAHERLGHDTEACEHLARFEVRYASTLLNQDFWDKLSRDNLRREAQALIPLDAVFPAQPFADP